MIRCVDREILLNWTHSNDSLKVFISTINNNKCYCIKIYVLIEYPSQSFTNRQTYADSEFVIQDIEIILLSLQCNLTNPPLPRPFIQCILKPFSSCRPTFKLLVVLEAAKFYTRTFNWWIFHSSYSLHVSQASFEVHFSLPECMHV